MIPEQVWDTDSIPARRLYPGRASGSAMPLAWAHAEFIKLVASRAIGHPFGRPEAIWQRYHGQRPAARLAFWFPHAAIGRFSAGMQLAVALPAAAIVHWGHDGWRDITDTPTTDSGLGFSVAVLDTAALPAGSRVDFTWREQENGAWAGRDVAVQIVTAPTELK
jgi:glucoamylase